MIRMYLKMEGIHRQPVTEKVRANIIPPYNPPWIMQNMSSKSFTLQIFVYNHSANHMTFVTEITIEWELYLVGGLEHFLFFHILEFHNH